MRIFTLLTMAAMLTGVLTVSAQEEMVTYTDDFSGTTNFKENGVTGTIWQGYTVNKGSYTDQNTDSIECKIQDGGLYIQSRNGSMGAAEDDAVFLYRNIKADTDFDVSVKIAGGTFVSFDGTEVMHNSAGICIRKPDYSSANYLYNHFFELWGFHNILKNVIDGNQEELVANSALADYPSLKEYPFMKVSKVGIKFTTYISPDGVEWIEMYSVERSDFAGSDLQIGLVQCTFNTTLGTAVLDDFKLTHSVNGNTSSAKSINAANDVKTYFNRNSGNIQIQSAQSMISKINVYSIDGRLVDSAKNLEAKSYSMPISKSGIYMVSVETNQGVKVSKVSVTR